MLKHCWRNETTFPLYEILRAAGPSPKSEPKFLVYEGATIPGVEVEKMCYFAASIFWRAAAHEWQYLDPPPTKLELGSLEEKLRTYLRGGAFPRNPVMIAVVSSGMESLRNMMITFPFLATRDPGKGFTQYRFTVPGFTFQMFTGYNIPVGLRAMCSVRTAGRQIYQTPDADYVNLKNGLAVVQRSPSKGSLAGSN